MRILFYVFCAICFIVGCLLGWWSNYKERKLAELLNLMRWLKSTLGPDLFFALEDLATHFSNDKKIPSIGHIESVCGYIENDVPTFKVKVLSAFLRTDEDNTAEDTAIVLNELLTERHKINCIQQNLPNGNMFPLFCIVDLKDLGTYSELVIVVRNYTNASGIINNYKNAKFMSNKLNMQNEAFNEEC